MQFFCVISQSWGRSTKPLWDLSLKYITMLGKHNFKIPFKQNVTAQDMEHQEKQNGCMCYMLCNKAHLFLDLTLEDLSIMEVV